MSTTPMVNSHSASALHARLQNGTRRARESSVRTVRTVRVREARVAEAAVWRLLENLRVSASVESAPARDRALRVVLGALLEGTNRDDRPVPLPSCAGPILIVRSGPWPLLRALLQEFRSWTSVPDVTVLCHRRDNAMLEQLARSSGVQLVPLNYPRFEPFNPGTLQRLLAADRQRWTATFLLDAARAGTSRSLDHITRTVASLPGDKFVWNGSGQVFRPLSLLETLGRERYEIVRRLLRWRARDGDPT